MKPLFNVQVNDMEQREKIRRILQMLSLKYNMTTGDMLESILTSEAKKNKIDVTPRVEL